MANLLHVSSSGYGTLVYEDGSSITTTCLGKGRYVRIDNGRQYPQLCRGGSRYGNTVIYDSDEQLALALNAKLYKTEARFVRAWRNINNKVQS